MKTAMTMAMMIALMTFSAKANAARYARNTSVTDYPVVTDSTTGLVWQGCAGGLSGDDCAIGSAATYTWDEALAYCESLSWGGHSDWRLPNRKELHSITDKNRSSPAIDTTAFPATPSNWFWSSSSYAYDVDAAWLVYFSNGHVGNYYKADPNHARCVRGGP